MSDWGYSNVNPLFVAVIKQLPLVKDMIHAFEKTNEEPLDDYEDDAYVNDARNRRAPNQRRYGPEF